MSYGISDWLTVLVIALLAGFGWTIGCAVAAEIINALKRPWRTP